MMHTELKVYKESMHLVKDIYEITTGFPKDEVWALTSQMKRAVISIPSNISEGAGRKSNKELAHFLSFALGSVTELDTQLDIANMLGFILDGESIVHIKERIQSVRLMLVGLQKTVLAREASPSHF